MKINRKVWLGRGGALTTQSGLDGFIEDGIWSADDRILTFCNQASGGLAALIYHGQQPQSANAFLLKKTGGALHLHLSLEAGGSRRVIRHRFQRVKILPYGWENHFQQFGLSIKSQLCLQGSSLVWQIQALNRRDEAVTLAPSLGLAEGALETRVNGQRTWSGPETWRGGLRFLAHDRLQTRTWIDTPGFMDTTIDSQTILLLASSDSQREVIDGEISLPPETLNPGMPGRTHTFFVICGSSEQQVGYDLDRLRAAPGSPMSEQAQRYEERAAAHPTLEVGGFPFAGAVYSLAPLYAEATRVTGSGALRSSAGGYYFVWGWDSLMGGHELARWGDPTGANELMDFIANHRAPDGSIPHRFDNDLQPLQVTGYGFISLLYISLLYQVYSETLDQDLLDRAYPVARQIFEALASQCDERGFYACLGMYPDAPLKLGRTPQGFVAYEVGFWYCACRMMEILSNLKCDSPPARSASQLAQSLEAAYLEAFFDPERSFLVDSISGQAGISNGTYPRYSLFPLHNAFGARLLGPVLKPVSQFIQEELFKPDGIRMVPVWDPHAGTETVTGDCWFLHFDLYCLKAFRRAGDGEAIDRWLRLANAYFSERCAIPELQMMVPGSTSSGSWQEAVGQIWQLFAMSGWTRGLLEGVVGLETNIGGLTYIPCQLSTPIRLRKFPFRGGTWDVDITGEGAWVDRMVIDGLPLQGSLIVPDGFYTNGRHRLQVTRCAQRPIAPCLLEAAGAAVIESTLEGHRLTVQLRAYSQVNIVFFSPDSPRVTINDSPVKAGWDPNKGIGTFDTTSGIQAIIIESNLNL